MPLTSGPLAARQNKGARSRLRAPCVVFSNPQDLAELEPHEALVHTSLSLELNLSLTGVDRGGNILSCRCRPSIAKFSNILDHLKDLGSLRERESLIAILDGELKRYRIAKLHCALLPVTLCSPVGFTVGVF